MPRSVAGLEPILPICQDSATLAGALELLGEWDHSRKWAPLSPSFPAAFLWSCARKEALCSDDRPRLCS